MNIPTIGGARGIFEIFVPGVFLLLNFAAIICLLPLTDESTKKIILDYASNPVISLVIIVCFGYLTGVILRLFRTEKADILTTIWYRIFDKFTPEAIWYRIFSSYLFSWDCVPGDDVEKLKKFLKDVLDIWWTENAKIRKSGGGTTLHISKGEKRSEIILDEIKKKATLEISDGRTFYLNVKKKHGKLNIYFNPHAKENEPLWVSERFPYIRWIGEVCKLTLPPEALGFYNTIWARSFRKRGSRQFFNFCKTMINSKC